MRDKALQDAIDLAGGPVSLGRVLGISSPAISQWDRAPAERVIAIEAAVDGKVSRHDLRPDLYPLDNFSDTPGGDRAEPGPQEAA